VFHKTPSECSVDHVSGLVFRRPQAASLRAALWSIFALPFSLALIDDGPQDHLAEAHEDTLV